MVKQNDITEIANLKLKPHNTVSHSNTKYSGLENSILDNWAP